MDGRISIDSLKVRIPLHQVEVIENSLHSKILKVREDTGEILGEIKNNGLTVKEDGISTHYVIGQVNIDGTMKGDFLMVLFNAKIIQERYFEGLTEDTIETAYYRMMEHGIVRFSLDALLDGLCVDVDIKRDMKMPYMDELMKSCISHTIPSPKKEHGYTSKNRADNRGIEWGTREWATPTKPFYKLYDKMRELLYHSVDFYKKYLKDVVDIDDLARLEGTIKNKKHFKQYGINDTSLRNVLGLSQDVLEGILSQMYSCWLERNLKPPKPNDKMTPEQQVFYNTISGFMALNLSYGEIEMMVLDGIESRATLSRKRDTMKQVYVDFIQGSERDDVSKNVLQGFKFMGMSE